MTDIKFFFVINFNNAREDFQTVGAFTKRVDAEKFAKDCEAGMLSGPGVMNGYFIETMSWADAMERELRFRVGALADLVKIVVERVEPRPGDAKGHVHFALSADTSELSGAIERLRL